MHTPTIALSGAAVLLFSAAASADPAPVEMPRRVRLEYIRGDGAQACEDEGAFRFLITTQMREDPFFAAASARLVVTIERQGAQYQGRAVLDDGNGAVLWTRVGSPGRSCPDVVRDLALVVFLNFDTYDPPAPPLPPKATREAPPSPRPSSEVPPLPLPSTPITYWEEPRPASPSGRRVVSAGGVVGFGIAPSISLGTSLAAGYRWSLASLSLELRGFLPASGLSPDRRHLLTTSRISGLLVPCVHWGIGLFCGLAEVGAQISTSDAYYPRTSATSIVAGGARAGFQTEFTRGFSARIFGDALLSMRSARLFLGDVPQWQTPFLSGAVSGALFWSF